LPDWSRSHRQQSRHIRMLSEVLSAIRALRTQGKDANSSSPSTVKGQSPIGPSVPTARKSKPGKERRQLKDG
jgi:hypothetical protein